MKKYLIPLIFIIISGGLMAYFYNERYPYNSDPTGLVQEESGKLGNTVENIYYFSSVSTTLTYLTNTTSTAVKTFNTMGMNQIDLSLQVTASSSDSASGIKVYLQFSEDGIDWFDDYPLNLNNLSPTTTPPQSAFVEIASSTPYMVWYPGTTDTLRRSFRFENINSSITRIQFELASSTLHSTIWGYAILER